VPITEVVSSDFLATVQPQLDEYQAEKEMANATRFSFMPPEPTVPISIRQRSIPVGSLRYLLQRKVF
jgi:hypothetical protein